MNRDTLKMAEQIPREKNVESFGHMPRNSITVSYGKFIFSFLRILHIDL